MVHWLEFDGIRCGAVKKNKQLEELRQYLRKYPTAKAEGYLKTAGDMFAKIVRLECNQSYADLDMDCNSMFDKSLKRHSHKPSNIEFSEYLTNEIYKGISIETNIMQRGIKIAEYDKEAAAERAQVRTKELLETLESGMKELYDSDKYKDYLKVMSKFPQYSSKNIMLIRKQMPTATKVCSYKMWREKFNRHVKKGAKSIYIYAPMGERKPETMLFEKLDPNTGKPMLDKDGNIITEELSTLPGAPRFRLVPVFDVASTHGEELPQLVEDLTGNVEHYEAFLQALKEVSPLPVEFEPMKTEQDGYCKFGEKIGIREGMSETQTVAAVIHEIVHARLHDKNMLPENAESKTKKIREIEAESCAFVVAGRFNIETAPNSFGYLATYGSRDMSELKASLDTIRKEASTLISDIEVRFNAVCKERGIDLTAKPQEQSVTAEPEKAAEAEYTTETRIENIAGMDFEFTEIVTGAGKAEQSTPERDNIHQFTVDYYKYIVDAYRNGVPRDSPHQVENDIAGLADILRNGKFDSFREAIERAGKNSNTPDRAASLLERLENISAQVKPAEQNIEAAKQEAGNVSIPIPDEIPPDPAIGVSEMSLFGYTADDMLPLTQSRAVELFGKDLTVYMLYSDNTEAMAFEQSEIENHDGIFGIERGEWLNSKEYEAAPEYTAQPEKDGEAAHEYDFINAKHDTFAIYQIKDDAEAARNYRFEGLDYLDKRGFEVNRDNYALIYSAPLMPDDTLEGIFKKFNLDCPKDFPGHTLSVSDVVVLQQSGDITSHYVDRFGYKDLPAFLGIEKQPEQSAPAVENTASLSEQKAVDYNQAPPLDIPEPPPPKPVDIPLYRQPPETARANDELPLYRQSLKLNRECAAAIETAINESHFKPQHYDLKAAAKIILAEYGAERVEWVLANTVQKQIYDGRYSSANKSWADGFDIKDKSSGFQINTHPYILNGFIDKVRETAREKPSLLADLEANEQKSKAQFGGQKAEPGKETQPKNKKETEV